MKVTVILLTFLLAFNSCQEEKKLPVSPDVKLEFKLAQDYPADSLELRVLKKDTIYLHEKVELSNSDIALVSKNKLNNGIILTFTKRGNERIANLSLTAFGKMLAILVDDKILIAPKVMGKISMSVQITGEFTNEEIDEIFIALTGS